MRFENEECMIVIAEHRDWRVIERERERERGERLKRGAKRCEKEGDD